MTKKPTAFVAYLRVSTVRQGESGLDLEAQRAAVEAFARHHGGGIVACFVEVETGKRSDRPELAKALEAARKAKATLLIAKLDRLARNVAFIATSWTRASNFSPAISPLPRASRCTFWRPLLRMKRAGLASAPRPPCRPQMRAAGSLAGLSLQRPSPTPGLPDPPMQQRLMKGRGQSFTTYKYEGFPAFRRSPVVCRRGASRRLQAARLGSQCRCLGCWPLRPEIAVAILGDCILAGPTPVRHWRLEGALF
jgi:hypothetical protein